MKKLLGTIAIVFGVFAFAAFTSASTADVLQPASDVVYDENLIVNATGIFDSVRIGKQDVGGVTFFNGTIVNETTDASSNGNPVTFGDDVRIDGEIWRTEKGGANPLKISDHVIPTADSTNNLGTSSNRWNDFYGVMGNYSGTLAVAGNTTLDSALTVAGDASFNSNVSQDPASEGILKGWAYVHSDGSLLTGHNVVSSSRESAGKYNVEFNFDVNDGSGNATRAYNATNSGQGGNVAIRWVGAGPHASNSKMVHLRARDAAGTLADSYFMITVY